MINKTNKPEIWDLYQTEERVGYKSKSGKSDPTYYFVKKLLKDKIISGKELLEIGYGDGGTLQLLSKEFENIYGADISPKNIEITKNEFEELKIRNADFFVLDLVDKLNIRKQYDVVLLNHVLEHFTKEELSIVIPNLLQLLKPNGKLIGAVPYNLPFTFRVCPCCNSKFEIDGHQIKYIEENFRENFLLFGFKEIILRNHNLEFYSRFDNNVKKTLRKWYYNLIKKSKGQLEFCLEKK